MRDAYNLRKCKTCKWWEPFSGACTNGDSKFRADFMDRDEACECWVRNRHERCGGTLEAREYHGRIYYYCYSCHFDFPYNPENAEPEQPKKKEKKYVEHDTRCDNCDKFGICFSKGNLVDITTRHDTRNHHINAPGSVCLKMVE